ncbi:hypothetical protein C2R22_03560 [Salinigranum rubrum]|uniref:Uncharacterized protein n=1 Tax=Salinigranum rubrum TaxID=755307 RepID=A0A2I8VG12_9EURY|nr:hypothetical protein [Salinigranum rubrum]AUV80851.1 hypothetical protein C2R22_03560 [Salinigranum rubrum]
MCDRGASSRNGRRGQLSLSVVEAAVGLLVVLAAATTFVVGLPEAESEEATLTVLAEDGLDVLDATPPDGDGTSRLTALARDRSGFVRERSHTDDQLRALYPDRVRYRLATPHGVVGDPLPPRGPVGRAMRESVGGRVTLWVWFR